MPGLSGVFSSGDEYGHLLCSWEDWKERRSWEGVGSRKRESWGGRAAGCRRLTPKKWKRWFANGDFC